MSAMAAGRPAGSSGTAARPERVTTAARTSRAIRDAAAAGSSEAAVAAEALLPLAPPVLPLLLPGCSLPLVSWLLLLLLLPP